eukprot:7961422-Pyramimonas_sp.AAC.1
MALALAIIRTPARPPGTDASAIFILPLRPPFGATCTCRNGNGAIAFFAFRNSCFGSMVEAHAAPLNSNER